MIVDEFERSSLRTPRATRRATPDALVRLRRFWRRFAAHPQAVGGLILFGVILALAIGAPWITPGVTPQTDFALQLGPGEFGPSLQDFPVRLFGNATGVFLHHSVLAEVTYGARPSLVIGLGAALLTAIIGTVLGAISGYAGGWVDAVVMRITDFALAFPFLPLVIAVGLVANEQYTVGSLLWIFTAVGWPGIARLVRATYLRLRTLEYAEAARAVGVPAWRIIFRHLLPNALGPVIVAATLNVGAFILAESTLDFLQLGIPETQVATWGNVLADARGYLDTNWWWTVFPGLAIAGTVLALHYISEGLLDALDVQ